MGAWGTGSFENDDASDWVWELDVSSDLQVCLRTLADPVWPERGIAAAEAIAAAAGRPAPDLPPEVGSWIGRLTTSPDELTLEITARRVRQLSGPGSDLHALWMESDEAAAWRRSIDDLLERLARR